MVRNFVPAGNQKVSLISSPVHWNVVFFFGLAFIISCSETPCHIYSSLSQ